MRVEKGRVRDRIRHSWDKLANAKQKGGMWFKGFSYYNLAFLAKQSWRIPNRSEELWVKTRKGVYFSNCSFLEAKNNAKSSWTWSRILEGRNC